MSARVATSGETAACERATIERGTSAAELMRRAGQGAADLISSAFPDIESTRIAVFTGTGNNGGDGWVVAGKLAGSGYLVRVVEVGNPRSPESVAAKDHALQSGAVQTASAEDEELIVDALLGTGAAGNPRGDVETAICDIQARQKNGAHVISLDLPSGLDATTGEHHKSVRADTSISFGTIKRGHLIARDVCGEIYVLDIGLAETDELTSLPLLIDAEWVRDRVPKIPASAHKGTRKSLAVIGGGKGMAGAAILAGNGALRSGIGVLRIVAWPGNSLPVHASIPAAIFQAWPENSAEAAALAKSIDAAAIGPGLGTSAETRGLVERVLIAWNGPAVVDADALNLFAAYSGSLGKLLNRRSSAITPHPAELGRLLGMAVEDVLRKRFEVGIDLSDRLNAAVLLKGSPTIVFAPTGERYVSAAGTAALATGGSGDVLTGVVGTLLAHMPDASLAAACAAFVHGRAAELCGFVRGTTLDDILHAMPVAWNEQLEKMPPGVIARLRSYS